MVMKGGWWWEKLRRGVRTAYFVVVMVASLLAVSLPLVVAICDAVVPCLLIPSFTCVGCVGVREHLRRYAFRSSLVDIPVVSIFRSLIIMCAYSICDLQALSHGSYLGTVTFCSFISILLLSFKACVFTLNSQFEQEASASLSRKRPHLKKSWGMPVLFLSSVVFALGHIVVAYHTSCKARRKLMFHRVDLEAVGPKKEAGPIKYLKQVIKESFRLHPPAPLLVPRETTELCIIDDKYEIPAKTRVIFNAAAMAADPAVWENPEEFSPERFEDSHVDFKGRHFELLPFGAGRRGCPGISFAIAVVELAAANLLFCFDWKLPEGVAAEDVDMEEKLGIVMHKKTPLCLVATPVEKCASHQIFYSV